jgi:hypothetical protein
MPFAERPDCGYLVVQDLYRPPFEVDAFLPAASFAEAGGSLTNLEGRVQGVNAVEAATTSGASAGAAAGSDRPRPDWQIFSSLASRLELPAAQYADDAAVRTAIRAAVPGFPDDGDRTARRMDATALPRRRTGAAAARSPASPGAGDGRAPAGRAPARRAGGRRFTLVPERPGFRHRGIDLATVVEGLGELSLERGFRMNPDDLKVLRVAGDGLVTIGWDGTEVVRRAVADPACPRHAVYAVADDADPWPAGPVAVRVRAGDRRPPRARKG